MSEQNKELKALLQAWFNEGFARVVVSNPRPGAQNSYKRATLRPVSVKGKTAYQLEQRTQTQAFHRNLAPEEASAALCGLLQDDFRQADCFTATGGCHTLKVSKKGKLLHTTARTKTDAPAPHAAPHNREKEYILAEGIPCGPLTELGVFTPEGKIVKSKYDKYKQINRFLEMVEDILPRQALDRPLRVVDFGCGKSYLTFVLYDYLTRIRKMQVEITGLDLKEEVIAHCNELAAKYGYDRLRFLCEDIRQYRPEGPVDVVVSLHACDTATDYVLFHAVCWKARYILSVPCCQHELHDQLQTGPLRLMTDYGIVKERFAALATDAMRGKLLEYCGYKTQLLELTDLSNSPKNILLRASRRPGGLPQARREELIGQIGAFTGAFGGSITLYRLLGQAGLLGSAIAACDGAEEDGEKG